MTALSIRRTNSDNPDFVELVTQLDTLLTELDGEEHAFYNQLNKTGMIKHVVVGYEEGLPVACGGIREFDAVSIEVKRMYVLPTHRSLGYAMQVLTELENWARELGYKKCVLETGKRQPEAISLYKKCGYSIRPNYGQYAGLKNSVCFEKNLS